jgi:hemerythrin
MSFLTWDESKMSVGVAILDKEQKKLVGMINELYEGIHSGRGDAILGQIIDRFIDQSTNHFAREERYFAETDYPDAESHKAEHRDFLNRLSLFKKKYNDEPTILLPLELVGFLKNWLVNHNLMVDRRYSAHLNMNGIK